MLELSMLTAALLGIVNVLGWTMLTYTLNGLAESAFLVQRKNTKLSQQIRSANLLFAEAARSGEAFAPLTPKLVELAAILPADIKISQLIFERGQEQATFAGTAKTREALLGFQQALAGLSWIREVRAPSSQLFQKDNINFEFRAVVQGFPSLSPALQPAKQPRSREIDLE